MTTVLLVPNKAHIVIEAQQQVGDLVGAFRAVWEQPAELAGPEKRPTVLAKSKPAGTQRLPASLSWAHCELLPKARNSNAPAFNEIEEWHAKVARRRDEAERAFQLASGTKPGTGHA